MENSAYSELFRTPDIQVNTGMEQTWFGFELSTFPAKVPNGDLLDYIQRGGSSPEGNWRAAERGSSCWKAMACQPFIP